MKLPSESTKMQQRGLATLIVFILLVLVSALVLANVKTLSHLKGELRLIEERQQPAIAQDRDRRAGETTVSEPGEVKQASGL